MYIVQSGVVHLYKTVTFVDPQDNQKVELQVLINRLEEGAFFGEEVLYEELDSRYMYTAKVDSFDCKLLAFEKGTNSKDFSTLLLAQSLKKALRLKLSCRNELLAKILATGVDKLRTCYGDQREAGLGSAEVDLQAGLPHCALCKNKHEKLNGILTRDIPRALLRKDPQAVGKQPCPEKEAVSKQTQAAGLPPVEVQATRLLTQRQKSFHKKNLSAELSSAILERSSNCVESARLESRKPSDFQEWSQRSPELLIKPESSQVTLPNISNSRLEKKPALLLASKHASSKSYGMGSIDTVSTINRQLKAKSLSRSHPSVIPDNKNCFNVCATLQQNMQKVQGYLELHKDGSQLGLSAKQSEEPNTSISKTQKGEKITPRVRLPKRLDKPHEFIFSKLLGKDSSLLFGNNNLPKLAGPSFSTLKKRVVQHHQAATHADEQSYRVFDKSINHSALLHERFPPDQGPSLPPSPSLSHESLKAKSRNNLQPGKFNSVTERRISISQRNNKLTKP